VRGFFFLSTASALDFLLFLKWIFITFCEVPQIPAISRTSIRPQLIFTPCPSPFLPPRVDPSSPFSDETRPLKKITCSLVRFLPTDENPQGCFRIRHPSNRSRSLFLPVSLLALEVKEGTKSNSPLELALPFLTDFFPFLSWRFFTERATGSSFQGRTELADTILVFRPFPLIFSSFLVPFFSPPTKPALLPP